MITNIKRLKNHEEFLGDDNILIMVDEIETMISKERSKNGAFEDLEKDFRDKIGKKRSFKYLHVRNWS